MLGISPTTLRTWDRRYELGPSTRHEGKHRRYSEDDVERLKRMVELTASGAEQVPLAELSRVLVGGPGWDGVPSPGGVQRVETLRAAVETIVKPDSGQTVLN